jgi:hypothetical protein
VCASHAEQALSQEYVSARHTHLHYIICQHAPKPAFSKGELIFAPRFRQHAHHLNECQAWPDNDVCQHSLQNIEPVYCSRQISQMEAAVDTQLSECWNSYVLAACKNDGWTSMHLSHLQHEVTTVLDGLHTQRSPNPPIQRPERGLWRQLQEPSIVVTRLELQTSNQV